MARSIETGHTSKKSIAEADETHPVMNIKGLAQKLAFHLLWNF